VAMLCSVTTFAPRSVSRTCSFECAMNSRAMSSPLSTTTSDRRMRTRHPDAKRLNDADYERAETS